MLLTGLSLYRALLRECSRPWLSNEKASHVRKIITARFRADKSLQSPSKITGSLNAGYEVRETGSMAFAGKIELINDPDRA